MSGFSDEELLQIVPGLKRNAIKLTRDLDVAEDLLSETLVKILSSRESFSPGSNFRAWCCIIMRNTFINHIRRNRRVEELSEEDEAIIPAVSNLDAHIVLDEVLAVLDGMPEHWAAVIELATLGYSYQEMAEKMCVEEGTVKSRLHRARSNLIKLSGMELSD